MDLCSACVGCSALYAPESLAFLPVASQSLDKSISVLIVCVTFVRLKRLVFVCFYRLYMTSNEETKAQTAVRSESTIFDKILAKGLKWTDE